MKAHILIFHVNDEEKVSKALAETFTGEFKPTAQKLKEASEKLEREGVKHALLLGADVGEEGSLENRVDLYVNWYLQQRPDLISKMGIGPGEASYVFYPSADEEIDPPEMPVEGVTYAVLLAVFMPIAAVSALWAYYALSQSA